MEEIHGLFTVALAAMDDAEVGQNSPLVLLVAELVKEDERLLEMLNRLRLGAALSESEREVVERQRLGLLVRHAGRGPQPVFDSEAAQQRPSNRKDDQEQDGERVSRFERQSSKGSDVGDRLGERPSVAGGRSYYGRSTPTSTSANPVVCASATAWARLWTPSFASTRWM